MPGLADMIQYSLKGKRDPSSLSQLGAGPLNLHQKRLRRGPFGPAVFASALQQTPAMQDWANPEQLAQTQGVEQAYAGADTMGRGARHAAAQLGLGRSFATASELNARQQAINEVSQSLLQASMLGQERRAMIEQMLFDTLSGGNLSTALGSAQHRAMAASPLQQFATVGGGLGALLGGGGKLLGGIAQLGATGGGGDDIAGSAMGG